MTTTPSYSQPTTTNALKDVLNPRGGEGGIQQRASRAREYWIAAYPEDGGPARAEDFVLLIDLREGDTGPTPEAVTEDVVYHGGRTVTKQTGVNNGGKTLTIDAGLEDPQCLILIDHCTLPGYGVPGKAGQIFAYQQFNFDGSAFEGSASVGTAAAPNDAGGRWDFGVVFETVNLRRPSQNPVAGLVGDNIPTASAMTPTTGPVGTVVTFTGEELTLVDAVFFGDTRVERAAFAATPNPSATTFAVAVPNGVLVAEIAVEFDVDGQAIPTGQTFTVTAT